MAIRGSSFGWPGTEGESWLVRVSALGGAVDVVAGNSVDCLGGSGAGVWAESLEKYQPAARPRAVSRKMPVAIGETGFFLVAGLFGWVIVSHPGCVEEGNIAKKIYCIADRVRGQNKKQAGF